jgi:DNA polymerase
VDEVIELLESERFEEIEQRYKNRTLEAVGSCMRGFFKAPEGKVFVRADYNAIEARVLMWAAGQTDAVELFHSGEDIYCDMASYIFGVPASEIKAGHKAGILEFSNMRKLGKDTVLGCGYNMGVATFLVQAESKGEDTINNIPIREDLALRGQRDKETFNPDAWKMAAKAVYGYREKYARVPKLWASFDRAVKLTIRERRKYTVRKGLVKFYMEGDDLVMLLPSGRTIYYPNAELVKRENKWTGVQEDAIRFRTVLESGKFVWEYTYGGKLVENAVQAIARDLLVYGMYNAANAGFELIGTVHDEIISLFNRLKVTKRTVKKFVRTICQLPIWAIGETLGTTIPLTAEGEIGDRYGK